jgi:alpha-1,6-mannosyltransferase
VNDLAEKALQALAVTRRAVAARPAPALAAAGAGAAAATVVTGGRLGAAPAAVPYNVWFGLLPGASYQITGPGLGFGMLAAIAALVAMWLLALRLAAQSRLAVRAVWGCAAAWAAPFAIGPPLLSTDLFSAVTRGLLARDGLSPYHHPPGDLGPARVVDAIDPTLRTVRSIDGPLANLVSHLAVSIGGGRPLAALIVLRVVAVLSVIVIGRCALVLGAAHRPSALTMAVLNPVVLLFVVSAGQYAGLLAAVLLACFVAARRHRWISAIVLAAVAAGIKPIALLAVVVVIATHVHARDRRLRTRILLRDGTVAVGVLVGCTFAVPYGLGWAWNLSEAIHNTVPFAPASVVADVVGWMVPPASYDDLQTGGRISAAAAAVTVVCYLFATMRRRPLEQTVGYALLWAAILAPVVYPSVLAFGLVCLAPVVVGVYRGWVVALSCGACVLTPVGFSERGAQFVTLGGLVVIAAGLVPRLVRAYRPAAPVSVDEPRSEHPVPGSS